MYNLCLVRVILWLFTDLNCDLASKLVLVKVLKSFLDVSALCSIPALVIFFEIFEISVQKIFSSFFALLVIETHCSSNTDNPEAGLNKRLCRYLAVCFVHCIVIFLFLLNIP